MKKFFYVATVIWFAISLTSCGSSMAIKNDSKEKEVVYTLKSKMELMEQKIYNKNSKTIIAIP